jgi:hypothetical protein
VAIIILGLLVLVVINLPLAELMERAPDADDHPIRRSARALSLMLAVLTALATLNNTAKNGSFIARLKTS